MSADDLTRHLATPGTFATIMEYLPNPVLIGDEHGIVYANRAAILAFGIDPQATGRIPFDIVHDHWQPCDSTTNERIEANDHPFRSALRGQAASCELRLHLDPAQPVTFACSSIPLWYEGRLLGAVVTHTDITALHQTSDTLRTANGALEQFSAIAAHDLKEPLRLIGSFLDLTASCASVSRDAVASRYIGIAINAVNRMRQLMDGLLELTRIGRQDLKRNRFDCREVISEALGNLQGMIDECGATIDVGDMPLVFADRSHFIILFQNLIGNALKYRRSGLPAIITIRARYEERAAIISISDNGIGIPQEHRKAIFAPFRRLHGSGHKPGTGLGLDICRKIVERNHGTIWVESEDGAGSTFSFSVPLHPEESALEERR